MVDNDLVSLALEILGYDKILSMIDCIIDEIKEKIVNQVLDEYFSSNFNKISDMLSSINSNSTEFSDINNYKDLVRKAMIDLVKYLSEDDLGIEVIYKDLNTYIVEVFYYKLGYFKNKDDAERLAEMIKDLKIKINEYIRSNNQISVLMKLRDKLKSKLDMLQMDLKNKLINQISE